MKTKTVKIALFAALWMAFIAVAGAQPAARKEQAKERVEAARIGLVTHRAAHAMRAEHQRGPRRHVGQVLDEDRALGLEVVDHVGVVHDLVAHVDRRTELAQRPLDDLDGPVDAGTDAPRLGQQHLLQGRLAGIAQRLIGW